MCSPRCVVRVFTNRTADCITYLVRDILRLKHLGLLLCAFVKLREVNVRFMSVRLSVRMKQLGYHWTYFH